MYIELYYDGECKLTEGEVSLYSHHHKNVLGLKRENIYIFLDEPDDSFLRNNSSYV